MVLRPDQALSARFTHTFAAGERQAPTDASVRAKMCGVDPEFGVLIGLKITEAMSRRST